MTINELMMKLDAFHYAYGNIDVMIDMGVEGEQLETKIAEPRPIKGLMVGNLAKENQPVERILLF